jgi:non-ribosomal peptide synthetase component F
MISVREQGQNLHVKWEYSKDLFDETTIKRMLQHYSVLLDAIASDPETRISDLPLLDEALRIRCMSLSHVFSSFRLRTLRTPWRSHAETHRSRIES